MSELSRLVDNGRAVIVFANALGSYTAAVVPEGLIDRAMESDEADITDDFTPEKAMSRLADKQCGVGDYA